MSPRPGPLLPGELSMLESVKLSIKASELRSKINAIQMESTPSEDQRADRDRLAGELAGVEVEYRAALSSEDRAANVETRETTAGGDAETRERLELRGRAQIHRYVGAVLGGVSVDGAESECSSAFGCPGLIPLELFGGEGGAPEMRAHTPGPAADTVTNTAATVHPVFDQSVASYLGIEMPSVASGQANYPILGTSVTAGPKAKGAAGPETAGAFSVKTAAPKRITGSFRIRREDLALLASLEMDLRRNLQSVMVDAYDGQVINGDNQDPNLNGLLAQLTDPSAPAAAAETFSGYVGAFAGHVDGKMATELSGVRALVGTATYRHLAATFASNQDSTSALSYLRAQTGGVRASGRIAAPASHIQQAIIRRSNPAGDRAAVSPIWQGLELIRDQYTDASKGEVIVTALMLVGDPVLLRSDAFVQDSFRLAA